MYDNRFNWCIKKSKHFIFKFPKNTHIEVDIDIIAKNREFAYKKISEILKVKADGLITLYFSPSREFCISKKMLPQAAIPHKYFASLIYDEFDLCHEKIKYGHEIAHLILYFWDKNIYHLEFLEEGLATILDMSGLNYHLEFLNKIKYQLGRQIINLSLKVNHVYCSTDYEKAASFVKF